MATGCCGVKKQKLATNSSNSSTYANNNAGSSSNGYCNGVAINGYKAVRQPKVANKEMVVFCFDVLYNYLHSADPPKPPKFPNEQFPLFVTWKLGKEKKLRGCIGTFNSTSLHQGLREYAITSACKDSRFDPITVEDFTRLHCSISLLLDFEVADHYLDWEIGRHGIRIEFSSEKGAKKAATYLPEVAVEQGWNQIQTIDSLLRKGGYKGTITPETRTSVCLIRFQSEKVTVSYSEYIAHKRGYAPIDDSQQNNDQQSSSNYSNGYHHPQNNSTSSSTNNAARSTTVVTNVLASALRFSTHGVNGYAQQQQQQQQSSSSSVGGHYRGNYVGGGRCSPTPPTSTNAAAGSTSNQRNSSHHPSPNAARYLPLPSHPYMPPPSM